MQFKSLLSLYEQQEILNWPEIYFAGSATIEKIGTSKRRTGADMHDVYNLSGTNFDQDGNVYNNGASILILRIRRFKGRSLPY